MRSKHLMRTQPRNIWETVGSDGQSPLQIIEEVLLQKNVELYEKREFSNRVPRQLELPIEMAGSSIENPRDVMSPALIGKICLAYQGFMAFLPDNDMVLQIDWDESKLPTFVGVKKAVMSELNKSEALRDLMSSVAVGCLLPERTCSNGGLMNVQSSLNEGNKDDQWELKKQFLNMRQNYHESWIKHQKNTFEEQKCAITPMYVGMNCDTKKMVQNEMAGGNHVGLDIVKANEQQSFLHC